MRSPWKPWFYAGSDDAGNPVFSDLETDAAPLSDPSGSSIEPYDMVNQQSVRWIPQLEKWLMLYGGDAPAEALLQGLPVVRDPTTPMLVRFADKPWGPWTPGTPIYLGGDSATATGAFGPGGIAHSPACVGSTCAPGEIIIPEWTMDRCATIDLFWNMSTYAPYQVFLMRSTITK